jgi:hypothetical protein
MNHRQASLIAVLGGVTIEILVAAMTGNLEAWDSPAFWILGIPFGVVLCGMLGYRAPAGAFFYGPVLMASQFLTMVVASGGGGSLLPIGMILSGLLSVPCIGSAFVGVAIRTRREKRAAGGG